MIEDVDAFGLEEGGLDLPRYHAAADFGTGGTGEPPDDEKTPAQMLLGELYALVTKMGSAELKSRMVQRQLSERPKVWVPGQAN
jgi:hypothetical protein